MSSADETGSTENVAATTIKSIEWKRIENKTTACPAAKLKTKGYAMHTRTNWTMESKQTKIYWFITLALFIVYALFSTSTHKRIYWKQSHCDCAESAEGAYVPHESTMFSCIFHIWFFLFQCHVFAYCIVWWYLFQLFSQKKINAIDTNFYVNAFISVFIFTFLLLLSLIPSQYCWLWNVYFFCLDTTRSLRRSSLSRWIQQINARWPYSMEMSNLQRPPDTGENKKRIWNATVSGTQKNTLLEWPSLCERPNDSAKYQI